MTRESFSQLDFGEMVVKSLERCTDIAQDIESDEHALLMIDVILFNLEHAIKGLMHRLNKRNIQDAISEIDTLLQEKHYISDRAYKTGKRIKEYLVPYLCRQPVYDIDKAVHLGLSNEIVLQMKRANESTDATYERHLL